MVIEFNSKRELRRYGLLGSGRCSKIVVLFLAAMGLLLLNANAHGGVQALSAGNASTVSGSFPEKTSIFSLSTNSKSRIKSLGENYALLEVNRKSLGLLRTIKTGNQIIISILLAPGLEVSASVTRHEIYKKEAKTVLMTDAGPIDVQRPDLYFYRGQIDGKSTSWIELTVGRGYVIGTASYNRGIYRFGPLEKPSASINVPHISYSADSFDTSSWEERPFCALSEQNAAQFNIGGSGTDSGLNLENLSISDTEKPEDNASAVYDQVELALDGDYEMYTKFGNDEAAVFSYYASLINTINTIYHNDLNVDLAIAYQTVWTTTSGSYPYTLNNTSGLLTQMRDYWNSNNTGIVRDLAFLLSGKTVQGGIAYVNALCHNSYGYGLTQVYGTDNTTTWNGMWDVVATAHELGHSHGSIHTHCYSPPIDECYSAERADCYNGIVNCTKGTLMSYCHLCGGMFNIDLNFHSRVVTVIRNSVDSASCLTPASTPPTVTTNAPTNVGQTSATLNSTVNPNGANTTVYYDYGLAISYGSSITYGDIDSGTTDLSLPMDVSDLQSNTTYHFRVRAKNSGGTTYGSDVTFMTSTMPPTVTTAAISSITSDSASSGGDVTSDGGDPFTARGVCWSTSVDPTISGDTTTDGTGTGSFTSSITGLNPATTYHVRAYATNTAGTGYGADESFTASCVSDPYVVSKDGTCGGETSCYGAIQDAVDAACTGSVIKIAQGTYTGSITLDADKSLTLQGGWDPSYTPPQISNTTFIKAPKAIQGSLALQMVSITP